MLCRALTAPKRKTASAFAGTVIITILTPSSYLTAVLVASPLNASGNHYGTDSESDYQPERQPAKERECDPHRTHASLLTYLVYTYEVAYRSDYQPRLLRPAPSPFTLLIHIQHTGHMSYPRFVRLVRLKH